jgi:glycosyltransferase involved in cell wall biosynthesis
MRCDFREVEPGRWKCSVCGFSYKGERTAVRTCRESSTNASSRLRCLAQPPLTAGSGPRLLFYLNAGWERYVSHSPCLNLIRAARRHADCHVELTDDLNQSPDVQSFDALIADLDFPAERLESLPDGVMKICLHDDIHRFTAADFARYRRVVDACDLVLTPYRFAELPATLFHLPPDQRGKYVALPHSIPDEPPPAATERRGACYRDVGAPAVYPFEAGVAALQLPEATVLPHPGRQDAAAMTSARESWFDRLARYRIGIIGLGWGRGGYVLAKYLEFLYAGCLLMGEHPPPIDCEMLGLRDGVNCFLFDWPEDRDRFLEIYHAAARDFAPFAPIAEAGRRLAIERHTASSRLRSIQRIVEFRRQHRRLPRTREAIDLVDGHAFATPTRKKLRVGFITPTLYWGGAERWLLELGRFTRHDLDWVGCAVLQETYRHANMVEDVGRIMPVWSCGADSVRRVARDAQIMIAWGTVNLKELVGDFSGPVVFVGHGQGEVDRQAAAGSVSGATHLAAVARASLRAFNGVAPLDQIQVLYNGIDPARCIATRSRQVVRRELGVAESEWLVGYLGRMVPEKNVVAIARAVATLPEDFHPVFVGGGWDLERQRHQVRQILKDRVAFADQTEEVGNYLNAFDCFVMASPAEGMPLALLEAGYAGVPAISTKVGAIEELEELHGPLWETIPAPADPKELAAGIMKLRRTAPPDLAAWTNRIRGIIGVHYLAQHMAGRWIEYLHRVSADNTGVRT